MLTIGLTGGIGSGKSTAARFLAELGAPVIDADKVGHMIYEPGEPAYHELVREFGDQIIDPTGRVDRKRLGAIVFSDPESLARLNAIVHPRMLERIRALIDERRAAGEKQPIVVEAAILIEAGWDAVCDEVWLVSVPAEVAIERLGRDRGISPDEARRRLAAQMSDAERRRHATLVIDNIGTAEDLRAKMTQMWREVLERAGLAWISGPDRERR